MKFAGMTVFIRACCIDKKRKKEVTTHCFHLELSFTYVNKTCIIPIAALHKPHDKCTLTPPAAERILG